SLHLPGLLNVGQLAQGIVVVMTMLQVEQEVDSLSLRVGHCVARRCGWAQVYGQSLTSKNKLFLKIAIYYVFVRAISCRVYHSNKKLPYFGFTLFVYIYRSGANSNKHQGQ